MEAYIATNHVVFLSLLGHVPKACAPWYEDKSARHIDGEMRMNDE